MTERGMQIKSDGRTQTSENSEFPILCETCLGDNPYVRMIREPCGKACKTCDRPFTNFRWKAGTDGRYKSTQVCQSCAKAKNVCQCCILDLTYGLPVQVRDSFMSQGQVLSVPKNTANRAAFMQEMDKKAANGELPYGKAPLNAQLLRLSRRSPYSERNLPHICSFYARGCCTRGASCPYRHVKPHDDDDPLNKQNVRDRFDGKDDPVALKILARLKKEKEEEEKKKEKEEENDEAIPKVY
ncbi:hypothetical protein WA158_007129 [Blastocystis sp. Blastoise]